MSDDDQWSRYAGYIVGFLVVIGAATVVLGATGYLNSSGSVDGPGLIAAPNGPGINVTGSTTMNLSDPPDPGNLTLRSADGNITFLSSGMSNGTIHVDQFDGPWTNLTALDVQNTMTVDAEGMAPFQVGGDAETISVAKTRVADDGVVDFAYSGPSGTSTVALWGLTSGSQYAAIDDGSTAVLDVTSANNSGVATWTLPNSAHDVRLQTSDGGPSLSNLQPDDDTIRWSNETLSVDVSDPDLPEDNVTVEFYVDGSLVDTQYATSNGTVTTTITGLAEGSHSWSVNATDAYGQSVSSATKSFTVDHYEPRVLNPQPTGPLSTYPGELNITVRDGDFAWDGDSLDIYFYLDGSQIATDTLTANGTSSTVVNDVSAGEHTWSVAVQDQYGQWTNQSFSFKSPNELRILNESAPTQLVDTVTVELQFYEDGVAGNTYSRSTNDGTINMTGLPATKSFVVVAKADGYHPRRVFIPSLFDTQRVFLLPSNKTVVDTIFTMESYTGAYPQDTTVLEVQRTLDGSWQTVVGDYFGASGEFQSQLRYNTRHRLMLRNPATGQTRVLGYYTPLTASEQTLTVSPEGVENISGAGVLTEVYPQARTLPARDDVNLNASLQTGSETTIANWTVKVYYDETNGGNTTLKTERSFSSDGGTISPTIDLAGRPAGDVVVSIEYYTEDGGHGSTKVTYNVNSVAESEFSLLALLDDLVGLIAPENQSIFQATLAIVLSVVLTAVVAARWRMSTEMIGLVHAGLITAFTILGWVGYNLLFVVVVGWGSLSFLGRRY